MSDLAFQQSLPKKRMAAGALILDQRGELLIVKPTYRDDWLIPGGSIEVDESPREACVRETYEEVGLDLPITRILLIEYQHGGDNRTENIQFIFDGGVLTQEQIEQIVIPSNELSQYAFVPYEDALRLLNQRLARRITHALPAREQGRIVYLEDGVPLT